MPDLELRPQTGGQWAVAEPGGAVLFRGSLRECEDWLDAGENRRRLAAGEAARGRRGAGKVLGRLAGFGAALAALAFVARAVAAAFRRDRPPGRA